MKRLPLTVVALVAALTISASSPALANSNFADTPPPAAQPSEGESEPQISEENATGDEVAWVNDFNIIATQISVAYEGEFAVAEVLPNLQSGWIGFKNAVPDDISDTIRNNPQIELRENLGYSEIDAQETISEIVDVAVENLGETTNVIAGQSGADPLIEVEVGFPDLDKSPRRDPSATDGDAAIEAIQEEVQELADRFNFDLDLKYTEGLTYGEEAHTAGGKIKNNGSSSVLYSTAFPVKQKNGSGIGVLTAGHCPGSGVTYNTTPNAFYSPVPYSQVTDNIRPVGGDFRWNHSKAMFNGKTFVGSGRPARTFRTYADASVNSPICNFGHTTGYKCTTVKYTNQFIHVYVPEINTTREVGPLRGNNTHFTQGGDSGGPWFYGTVAYGVHSGHKNDLRSVFSDVSNALLRLGVVLWAG